MLPLRFRLRRLNNMRTIVEAERDTNGPETGEEGRQWMQKEEAMLKDLQASYEKADAYFGDDSKEKVVIWVLRICTITAVFIGSLTGSGIVWTLGDIGVGTMAWINIIAILLLSPKALKALRDYEKQKREGVEPLFDPQKLEIANADFWASQNAVSELRPAAEKS